MSPCTRMWRGYSRPFIANELGWCTKVSLLCVIMPGPILTTGVVTDFDVMAWMLHNTLPKSHSLGPSDFRLFGPCMKCLAGKGFGAYANMKQTVTSWLQTLDTNVLYMGVQASLPQWDKCMNVTSACVEVWCVLSTAEMPRIHQRLNKVFDVWEFVNFLKILLISTLMLNVIFHVVYCLQKLSQTAPVSAMPQMSLRHIQHQPKGEDDCKIWRFHFAEPLC